jgi:hypothetical protein
MYMSNSIGNEIIFFSSFKTTLLQILECSWTIRLKTNKKIFHYSMLTKQLFPHFLNLRNDIPIGISRLKQFYINNHSRVWIKGLQMDNLDEKPIGTNPMPGFNKVQYQIWHVNQMVMVNQDVYILKFLQVFTADLHTLFGLLQIFGGGRWRTPPWCSWWSPGSGWASRCFSTWGERNKPTCQIRWMGQGNSTWIKDLPDCDELYS